MNRAYPLWPLGLLILLIVLYFNSWMWDSNAIILGFPSNLLYHVGICVVSSLAMLAIVVFAWPHALDQDAD